MHPCSCGYYTDPRKACRCNPNKIAGYMGKISGPLLDRIDIHIKLPLVKYKEITVQFRRAHFRGDTIMALDGRMFLLNNLNFKSPFSICNVVSTV